jgi:hypothetical protein
MRRSGVRDIVGDIARQSVRHAPRHRDRGVLAHPLPLAIAPREDAAAATARPDTVGDDRLIAPRYGQVSAGVTRAGHDFRKRTFPLTT